jgi:hypothetical protein
VLPGNDHAFQHRDDRIVNVLEILHSSSPIQKLSHPTK